jgi:hypothetical protein
MVGDSLEDVECGNAAGTASCLIAGGGNEVAGAAAAGPPPGAVPTIKVDSLHELNRILLETRPGVGSRADAEELLGWRARVPGGEDPTAIAVAIMDPTDPGAPAPGLDFADWLIGVGGVGAGDGRGWPVGSLGRERRLGVDIGWHRRPAQKSRCQIESSR